jgi:drug/metabolite transporter (DMT)-like permease
MAMKRILAYAAIYLLWGASFLAIREIVAVSPPFFAAGVRFLLAGLLLFLFTRLRRRKMPSPAEWKAIIWLGLLFFVGDYGPLFWGEQRLPSGEAAVIAATIPTFVFLLEWLVLHRVRPHWLSMVGAALGLTGVCGLVLLSPAAGGATGLHADRYAAALVFAALSWSLATVLSRDATLPRDRSVTASLQMLVGGIGLLLLSAAFGEGHHLRAAVLQPRVLVSMAYLVLMASIAAFSAYVYLLSREPASRVASYAYVNPIVALALGAWLAGERLAPLQIVASIVVIAGTAATVLGKYRSGG